MRSPERKLKPQTSRAGMEAVVETDKAAMDEFDGSKNLNVMFNYNGHSWDAYEVLGAPAGSSIASVEKYLNQALKTSKKDSEEFLRTAYDAIVSDQRKSRHK